MNCMSELCVLNTVLAPCAVFLYPNKLWGPTSKNVLDVTPTETPDSVYQHVRTHNSRQDTSLTGIQNVRF